MGKNAKKKEVSYVEAHNRAVERFRKSSRILIWAGIFNVLGLGVGIGQVVTGNGETLPFYFCFGIVDFIYSTLIIKINNVYLGFAVLFLLAIGMSIGAIALSVNASQGKKKPLVIGAGLYFLDWVVVLVSYFLSLEGWTNLAMSCGFHLIIAACLAYAIYQYFNVINIEKRFAKVPPVNQEVEENDKAKGE